tara:strand:- start:901 stop:1152 length:252 start_codon:yes stop_codon:yes gene_type:complete
MAIYNREDIIGFVVGLFVVMFIVWITLPSEHDRVVSKKCYKMCKEAVSKIEVETGMFSGPAYEMSMCYEACKRELRDKNENIN